MKLMFETPSSEPLYKCPNPTRKKWIGPILLGWNTAKENWAHKKDDGTVVNSWIGFKTNSKGANIIINIIIWKLGIWIGF